MKVWYGSLLWMNFLTPPGGTDNAADIYKSTNHGQDFTVYVGQGGDLSATRYQLVIRASDVDPLICFAGGQDLFRTTNGGTSWDHVDGYSINPYSHPDFLGLDFNPIYPAKITVGNDGGVFRSDNLYYSSPYSCNQNLGSLSLMWGLASSTYDANFVAGGLHDHGYGYNLNAVPGSTGWTSVDFGKDGGNMVASPFLSKHFVANKTWDKELHFSSNGSVFNTSSGYDPSTTAAVDPEPFAQHPSQPGVVYTARYGLHNWGWTIRWMCISGNPLIMVQTGMS